MTNTDLLKLSNDELLKLIPDDKRRLLRDFIHELNRREYEVRFVKSCDWDGFRTKEKFGDEFGYGLHVEGKAVPYFHPNRSFHDEIIWLDKQVYYNDECKFEDKLINAAIVKFYGPSNTVDIITRGSDKGFIQYDKLINDDDYVANCMNNIHVAMGNKEKIFGTTELRTSLQTESRNYTRMIETPYDKMLGLKADPKRNGRSSDMIYWFRKLGPMFKEFYSTQPTMEESFNFLTSFRGIGNYYGYHFSTNLARMPLIGTKELLRPGSKVGRLNEDDEFVAPGVGAMITIRWFYQHLGLDVNEKVGRRVVQAIRADQDNFFEFEGESKEILKTVFETGYMTTFGCEISCCQFGIFNRLKNNKKLAIKRSQAPISKEGVETNIETDCVIPKKPKTMGNRRLEKEFTEIVLSDIYIPPTIKEEPKEGPKEEPKVPKEKPPHKERKSTGTSYKVDMRNVKIILDLIEELNTDNFSHSQIGLLIETKGITDLKQESNWKESWQILQWLVEKGKLRKEKTRYIKLYKMK